MKKWLNSIKLIVLIILIVGFIAYNYLTKNVEGFQQETDDFQTKYFDVSANYFTLSEKERSAGFKESEDMPFDIGSLFSGFDNKNIPWDSENVFLNPKDVLWGVVPKEASADLYNKVYVAQQLKALRIADDNKFYFDSALLHYGTADPFVGQFLEISDFLANFTAPLLIPEVAQLIYKAGGGDLEASEASKKQLAGSIEKKKAQIAAAKKKIGDTYKSLMEKLTQSKKTDVSNVMDSEPQKRELKHSKMRTLLRVEDPETKSKPSVENKPIKTPAVEAERILKTQSTTIKSKALRICGKVFLIIFDWIELIPHLLTKAILNFIYMSIIMPIIMAMSMPLVAPRKGSVAYVENQIAGVITTLVVMAATSFASVVTSTIAEATGADPISKGAAIALQIATYGSAVAGALAAFFLQKDAVPNGYRSVIEKMIESSGHGSGDGKCPTGFMAINEIVNPTTNIFFSFVPIIGDLCDLMYPYLCIRTNFMESNDRAQNFFENLITIRDPYIAPKYLDYHWISSIFLDWPDYNSKYSADSAITQTGARQYVTKGVGGKKRMIPAVNLERSAQALGALVGTNAAPNMNAYYSWVNYTNFNDIAKNPNEYFNIDVQLEQFNQKLTFEYIGGKTSKDSPNPDPNFRFFYLDFTEPSILVEMAQFYYNYAIKKPFPNDDGTFTVQYISKINYVVASSLFTCDAMCEMTNVTYNPISGEKIKEEISFDSDRRFYFRWKPDPTKTDGSCLPITDIWGLNKGNASWKQLDDAYDEAIYRLNDALHFPTDPTLDGTGLISAELLVSAYEQYKENKERSEYAADYIYRVYTATPQLRTQFSALVNAKTALDTATANLANALPTTKQLAGMDSLTAEQTAFINAQTAFDNSISQAQPFYLDLLINTNKAKQAYLTVLGKIYTNNENQTIFWNNDLVFNENDIVNDLQAKIQDVINAREALWTLHKTDKPVKFNNELQNRIPTDTATAEEQAYHRTKYFDVTGCTFLDGAAAEVRAPDVANEELDIRFPVQFDVMPYLKRCSFINITTDRCIDLSNVEMVIDAFKQQNPTKRIKTIHNIQAKGHNVCQFIWDEVDISNPSVVSRKTNRILYQQDLSACTFCLPRDSANKPKLYADTTGNTSIAIIPPPTATSQPRRYNKPIIGKNSDTPLQFLNAQYMKPQNISLTGGPASFTIESTPDTMPRYNPVNYYRLPDLIRPKKPIRIIYPPETEAKLANQESNYCGNPNIMSNFMLKYNKNTLNTEKILNIQRAFTTSENSCDYEVDVLIPVPKKPDGTEYYGKRITNIVYINKETTTIKTDLEPKEYFVDMVIDVRYDLKINLVFDAKGIVYKLTTDDDNADYRFEPVTAYYTNTSIKGVFQAIQGLRKIVNIDYTKKEITYANDMNRFPDNIDSETIGPATFTLTGGLTMDVENPTSTNPTYNYNNPGTSFLRFTVARKTISANMTSSGDMTEPFVNTPFTYQSLKTGTAGQGLSIQANTSTLNGEYSNSGFNFNRPINDNTNEIFGSNTNFYNDNLVSNYVASVSNLRDSSKTFLSNIYNSITLSNNGVNTGKKCSDPDIMQRIMDSYNNFSTPTGLFNQEKNTMIQIVQASTDSNNNCHVIFENKNEYFADYYSYDKFGSNNYTQTNTLMFKRYPVVFDTAVNSFKPDTTSVNFNSTLFASDLALSLGTNLPTYFKSLRTPGICQVDGNNITLYNAFKTDYQTRTSNTIIELVKTMNIGFDRTDYLIKQTMKGVRSNIDIKNIVRVKYTLGPYNGTNSCSWIYTPPSYKVQMVAPNNEVKTNLNYSYIQFIDTAPTSLETSDNISPLFMDPEYTGAKPSDVNQRF